jgi:hypothetical protein
MVLKASLLSKADVCRLPSFSEGKQKNTVNAARGMAEFEEIGVVVGQTNYPMRQACVLVAFLLVVLGGCASGPNSSTSTSSAPVNPTQSETATPTETDPASAPPSTPQGPTLIQFALTINDQGTFDATNGLYAIMLNSFNLPIEVSNNDKFTDFIVWDGTYLLWYHRQALPSNNLFTFVATATLNQNLSFTADRRTMNITFSTTDRTNTFNQFITTSAFTAAAATTDRNGILGRILDTMGPGPSLDNDALYTYFIDKTLGVTNPAPPEYPTDALNDWTTHSLGDNFPYVNFDIERFEITVH